MYWPLVWILIANFTVIQTAPVTNVSILEFSLIDLPISTFNRQLYELCLYLQTDQNEIFLQSVGIVHNKAYFGFFYGGSISNPYLHLFGVNLRKVSLKVPSIDLTSAVYEQHPTVGELTFNEKAASICVCNYENVQTVLFYKKIFGSPNVTFYKLTQEKIEPIIFTQYNNTQIADDIKGFISGNGQNCLHKMQKQNGKILFNVK